MVTDGHDLRLVMQMFHGRRGMSPRADAETLVLCPLKLGEVGRLQIRRVDGGRIGHHRLSQASVRQFQILLGVTPIRARQGFHHFETRRDLTRN